MSGSNSQTGGEYEKLVRRIMVELRSVMREPTIEVSELQQSQMGASGYQHKIDLSVRATDGLTLLECKCWQEGIDPEAVLCLAARVYDIRKMSGGIVRGALVTKNGLGPGAQAVARFFDISLYDVRDEHQFSVLLAGDIHHRLSEAVPVSDGPAIVQLGPHEPNPQSREGRSDAASE